MDLNQYPKQALEFVNSSKGDILQTTLSPLIENIKERTYSPEELDNDRAYKTTLKYYFDQSKKLLDKVSVSFPEDKNVQYLQDVYKVISYRTAIIPGKGRVKTRLHPAFYLFLDLMETLRRTAFLSMSPFRGNKAVLTGKQDNRFVSQSISNMKEVDPMFFEPVFMERVNTYLSDYQKLKDKYFAGVEWATDASLKALASITWADQEEREKILLLTAEQGGQLKAMFPPTQEAFADGVAFFRDVIMDRLRDQMMDVTKGMTYYAPFFKGNLHPYFCYDERTQQAYLAKLAELPEQRNKNVIMLLQDAEHGKNKGSFLPGVLFFYQALKEALPAEKVAKELETITATARVNATKADKIHYPLDKVNSNLWGDLENTPNGQLSFSTVQTGKKKQATILATLNFANIDGMKITKKLTPFDKRVYIAGAALWNAGNEMASLTQIHYAMGNTTRPANYQIKKIDEAITKMTTARLYLDNIREVELKYKYKKFKYDGSLLPMERVTGTINGKLADAAIHFLREPPLMTFARERNQITTFDVKLLQSSISKTDNNLAIEDYLIERIAGAKNAAKKNKKVVINAILLETLYNNCGIKSRMQKSRAFKIIKGYLDHFKKSGYIAKYVIDADKITFFFDK